MGYNARNDEIRDNVTRMRREWEAQRGALSTVRRFNAILSAKGYVWFWPKIVAAPTSKHHWLIITCDSCGTVVDYTTSNYTKLYACISAGAPKGSRNLVHGGYFRLGQSHVTTFGEHRL